MILYINGDSHAAGAEASIEYGWAMDDPDLYHLGKAPHPINEAISFGANLSMLLGVPRINTSQCGCSNDCIRRTTRDWIKRNPHLIEHTFMLIQWSTWEREEWFYEDEYWQVNASGIDHVPLALEERYKQFVIDVDWEVCATREHEKIWEFHQELRNQNIRHLMFSANSHFGGDQYMPGSFIPMDDRKNWSNQYIHPYDGDSTYSSILQKNGFKPVFPASYHFGKDAHCFWADFLLQYMKQHQLLEPHEIPADRQH